MKESMIKVCHLTSVHTRYDIRIFLKECTSLAESGFHTCLIVADDKGDEYKNNVYIYDVGASKGRLDRIKNAPARVLKKAIELDAEIYHLHDPELIPIGIKLKSLGKKVIFDAHEDFPKQLRSKPYLNKVLQIVLSNMAHFYENWACRKFDTIVTATPVIRDKFKKINSNSIDINNYPLLGELDSGIIDWSSKKNYVAYIGGISAIRGVSEVIESLAHTKNKVSLRLGGQFSPRNLRDTVSKKEGWVFVNELGHIDRESVKQELAASIAGVVTFLPVPNHIDAQPNKMFEYMSAGIPVIGSNFPLWKDIIEGSECGICVDPTKPIDIAKAIDYLCENPDVAERMGQNGKRAVLEKYNWKKESEKLVALYQSL